MRSQRIRYIFWTLIVMGCLNVRVTVANPMLSKPDAFYGTDEAKAIAETLLVYQLENGAWPKNYEWRKKLSAVDRQRLAAGKNQLSEATFDNGATHSEIRFMGRMFKTTRSPQYREAALKGLHFMLNAQYPNGGFSQFPFRTKGYHVHVTYNDGAMIGVLEVLREVGEGRLLAEMTDDGLRKKCRLAVSKGIACILKSQIRFEGKPALWCAQHDKDSLQPVKGRSYELPSFSGSESVGIVRFLLSVENPSKEVIASIEGAVAFFERLKLKGIRVETKTLPDGTHDRVVVHDPTAKPMWARFYDLKTLKPIFCNRDGIPREKLSDISYERRNGYSWLGYYPATLLEKDYPAWKVRIGKSGRGQEAGLLGTRCCAIAKRPVDYVEPRIDTRNPRWIFFSSACRPFGMMNLSPDTILKDDWGSGYIYDEPYIRSFSHIHGWQLFGIQVMPIRTFRDGPVLAEANKATFSHDDEVVHPGYHKVFLSDRNITAELTSTMRVGLHRYTYNSDDGQILFDVSSAFGKENKIGASSLKQVDARTFEGSFDMLPTSRRKKPFTCFFTAQLNQDVNVKEIKSGVALWSFTTGDKPVLLKVAISYTSIEGAKRNLAQELPHWDFDRVAREADTEWNEWLSKIEVEGGTENQRIKFYTDLWHVLLGRRVISDVDGKYPDNTGESFKIRQVRLDGEGQPLYHHHNFDGFWGFQWSIQNLWGLVYPKVMSDFCNTCLDLYDNGGLIPRGPSGGNYTFVMIGDPATLFMTSAYMQGIRDWDAEKAYKGLRKNAFVGGIRDRAGYETGDAPAGGGMHYYEKTGFIPLNKDGTGGHRQPASQTLEYNFQDWCLAQFASALGKTEDAAFFEARSHGWTNLFDQSTGYIRPKEKDGSWMNDFSPVYVNKFTAPGFVEGNSANYTWFVPHDYPRLAELMGGPAAAAKRLDIQFQKTRSKRFNANGKHHAEPWIDYGNQPATQLAYVFNHLGHPWLTQYWARQVKELCFGGTTPWCGYNDDEDQGQMGAVSAMLALGLFDIRGGADLIPCYELSAPVFDTITIHLDPRYYKGKSCVITAKNNRYEHPYIQSVLLNGKPLKGYRFPQSVLKEGGNIELVLGPEPLKDDSFCR